MSRSSAVPAPSQPLSCTVAVRPTRDLIDRLSGRDRESDHDLIHSLLILICQLAMPRAIISPSVLASDFGQLTAECNRMIKGGAEWLHMGALHTAHRELQRVSDRESRRCHGRVMHLLLCTRRYAHPLHRSVTLCRISPWVRPHSVSLAISVSYRRKARPFWPACRRVSQASSWIAT